MYTASIYFIVSIKIIFKMEGALNKCKLCGEVNQYNNGTCEPCKKSAVRSHRNARTYAVKIEKREKCVIHNKVLSTRGCAICILQQKQKMLKEKENNMMMKKQ